MKEEEQSVTPEVVQPEVMQQEVMQTEEVEVDEEITFNFNRSRQLLLNAQQEMTSQSTGQDRFIT